eukprot:scaffold2110_cov141-Pinguiococcus_pyrenoidosus.AAC.1
MAIFMRPLNEGCSDVRFRTWFVGFCRGLLWPARGLRCYATMLWTVLRPHERYLRAYEKVASRQFLGKMPAGA